MKNETKNSKTPEQSTIKGEQDMVKRNMKTKGIKASIISALLILSLLATAIPFQALAGTVPSNAEITAAMVQDAANIQGVTLTGYYIGNYGGSSGNHYFTLIDEEGGGVFSKKMAQGKLPGMGTDTYDYRNYYRLNGQSNFATGDNYYWLSVECRTNSPKNIDMYWLAKPNDGSLRDYGVDLVNYGVQAKSSTEWQTIKILLNKNTEYNNIANVAVGGFGYVNDGTMTTEWRNFKVEQVTGSDTTVNVDSACSGMGAIAQQGDTTPSSSISLGTVKVNHSPSKPLCALPKTGYQFDGWYLGSTLLSKDPIYSSYVNEQTSNDPTTITAKFSATGQGNDNDTVALNEYMKDPEYPMDYEFAFMKNSTTASDWDIRAIWNREKELFVPEAMYEKPGNYAELTTPIYIDSSSKSLLLEDIFYYPLGNGYIKLEYLVDGKVVLTRDETPTFKDHDSNYFKYFLRDLGKISKGVHTLTIRYGILKDIDYTRDDNIDGYLLWNDCRFVSVRHISTSEQASDNSWLSKLSMGKTSYFAGETIEPSATSKYGTVIYNYYKDGKKIGSMPETYGNYSVTASATTTHGHDGLEESDPIPFTVSRKVSNATISLKYTEKIYYDAKNDTVMSNIKETANRPTAYSREDVHWQYSIDNGASWIEYTDTDSDAVNNAGHYLVRLVLDETDSYTAVVSNTLEVDVLPIPMRPDFYHGNAITITSKEYDGTTAIKGKINTIIYCDSFSKPAQEKDEAYPKIASATFNAVSPDAGTTKYKITNVVLDNPNYVFDEIYYNSEHIKNDLITKSTNSITSQSLGTNISYGKPLDHGVVAKFGGPITYTYLADNNGVQGEPISQAPTTAGSYWVKATTEETANYNSDTSAFTRFSILAGTPDITITPNESIVYDGKAIEPDKDFTVKIGGTTGDITSYEYRVKGTDKWSETAPTDAGDYQVRVSVAADENYIAATSDPVDVTIKKIKVTPEVNMVNDKVYDKTAEAFGVLTLDGDIVSGELPVASGTFVFDDVNVGKNKTVSVSDITLFDAKNYELTTTTLSNVETSAKITKCPITISGITAKDKVYDGQKDAKLDLTNAAFDGIIDGDSLTISATGKFSNKNAGNGKAVIISNLELGGDSINNYELASENQQEETTATISPKDVTISGTTVEATKEYDGNTVAKITDNGVLSDNFDGKNLVIKQGNANYSDKTVANSKAVTFTGFELDGSEKDNYNLTAQPASVTADITARELTVSVAVKDKQFDDNNNATFNGTPSLVGVVDGDTVNLTNGTPTFASSDVGNDIDINLTAFSISGADANNYLLTQPTGITASIQKYLVSEGTEYTVNSNDWQNTDFVVTAKDGYLLSKSNSANGTWTDSFTQAEETDTGVLKFYVKNTSTHAISEEVTETYKIDKTNPTGAISIGNNTWYTFLNTITFKLFFNETQTIEIEPDDALSGVAKVEYAKSSIALSFDRVKALKSWTEGESTNATIADGTYFIYYAKVTDNAGNVTYLSTDGAVYDTTNPAINGITNDKTYYTTQKFTAFDNNLYKVTVNSTEVTLPATLDGNTDKTYVIKATDKAGNETTYSVTMKTISSLEAPIDKITSSNVKSSDKSNIEDVKANTLAVDTENATQEEKDALQSITNNCDALLTNISETANEIQRITNAINAYSVDSVKSSDKNDIDKLISDIDTLCEAENVTEDEKTSLSAVKDTANGLLSKISATAAEIQRITNAVNDYSVDSVKSSDKKDIDTLIADIDKLCEAENVTEDEKTSLSAVKDTANGLLSKISATAAEIQRITNAVNDYSVETVKSSDKANLEELISNIDDLLNGDNITSEEKENLLLLKSTTLSLLNEIEKNKNAVNNDSVNNVSSINKDNVKISDKDALLEAKATLEDAINNHSDNYTDEELLSLNSKLATINESLDKIDELEKEQSESKKDNGKVSPKTGSTSNALSIALALLFLSGSTAEIAKNTKKRKKETE